MPTKKTRRAPPPRRAGQPSPLALARRFAQPALLDIQQEQQAAQAAAMQAQADAQMRAAEMQKFYEAQAPRIQDIYNQAAQLQSSLGRGYSQELGQVYGLSPGELIETGQAALSPATSFLTTGAAEAALSQKLGSYQPAVAAQELARIRSDLAGQLGELSGRRTKVLAGLPEEAYKIRSEREERAFDREQFEYQKWLNAQKLALSAVRASRGRGGGGGGRRSGGGRASARVSGPSMRIFQENIYEAAGNYMKSLSSETAPSVADAILGRGPTVIPASYEDVYRVTYEQYAPVAESYGLSDAALRRLVDRAVRAQGLTKPIRRKKAGTPRLQTGAPFTTWVWG